MIAARHETQRRSLPWPLVIFIMNRDGSDVRFVAQLVIEDDVRKGPVVKILSLAPIDPATCSNGVAVAQPEVTPGLVEDCRVLIRSRDAFGPRAPSGWTTDTPMGKWPGVVVGGNPPRVRELSLRHNIVTGTIPPDIGRLTMLELLELNNNSLLVGPIPPELGNLTMLLLLNGNNLSGPIPPELGNLTMLTVLTLDNNNLSGPIPPELGNLTTLSVLDLDNNNLSGAIPPELGDMRGLGRLGLQANDLTGCVPVELSSLWVEASGLERCTP